MNGPVTLTAGELRIEFHRDADRYRHEVVDCGDGLSSVLLASVEGIADEEWPASPPLQELHVEQRGDDKQVALLVGRAGRSHWSLSVEIDRAHRALTFDVACRSATAGDRLASSYRLAAGGLPASLPTGDRIALSSNIALEILEGKLQSETGDESILRIVPRPDQSASGKIQTFRWRYRIELPSKILER